MTEPSVLFHKRGRLGLITLNRPEAINALTHDMVIAITNALESWSADDEVQVVALNGSGTRGLCAGGDIVSIYEDAKNGSRGGGTGAGGSGGTVEFWRDEYILDAMIGRYPKPYVAIMDGIVLGGGIGLAAHGSHRIVTETSSVGLPETTIGFVPDVGGTFILSRAPGELGTHLALTAGSVKAADAIAIGFADHLVPQERIPALLEALADTDPEQAIAAAAEPPEAAPLLTQRPWIDAAYSSNDLGAIVERLLEAADGEGVTDAAAAAAAIARKSPTALHVTLASLRRARELATLEEALMQEFRVSVRSLQWPDLAEGIRAQVIDKDRNPQWNPATIDAVDAAFVERCFEPLAGGDLEIPGTHQGRRST